MLGWGISGLVFWTALTLVLLVLGIRTERRATQRLAEVEARAHLNKDQAFRFWATRHGGVYVPANERTPPNPNLSHVPERDVQTPSGRKLTLMNPAYMLRQMMDEFPTEYGVRGRITSLKPLRRPENAADAWETSALKAFESGVKEVSESTTVDGEPVLRLMRPMITQEGCLKCHAIQGYKVGDVRGGVGVALKLRPLQASEKEDITRDALSLGLVWAIGLAGICGITVRARRRIRERARAEEALRQSEASLDRSNMELARKNRELQDVLYATSHDLRSPLLNIAGFSQRIQKACEESRVRLEDPGLPEGARQAVLPAVSEQIPRALGFIRTSVEKMDTLIGGTLRLSRLGQVAMRCEPLDMNRLLSQVVSTLAMQVESAGAAVRIEPLPGCAGDAALLSQVFSNLLDNALKYRHPEWAPRVEISGRVEGGEAVYCVADNGAGIAAEHLESIWELFRRLNPMGPPGEGLGLNLVRRIVERHQGRVWVESALGEGARFFVALPVTALRNGGPD